MVASDATWCGARFVDRLQALAGAVVISDASAALSLDVVVAEIPPSLSTAEFATLRAVLITFLAKMATCRALPMDRLTGALRVCESSDAGSFRLAADRALAEIGCFHRPPVLQSDARVALALSYIRQHAPTGSTSVAAIAAHVRLSRWHLERLMRQHTGQPVTAHLRAVRMLAARQLLAGSLLTVKEIAAKSGYGSTSALSRDFKRTSGVSPLEWRRVRAKLSVNADVGGR